MLDDDSSVGVIKAVSAKPLPMLSEMRTIRVPMEFGIRLNREHPNWLVVLNGKTDKVGLVEKKQVENRNYPFARIPYEQDDPEIVLAWDGNRSMRITAPGVEYAADGTVLDFFITNPDDPHICHHRFRCQLEDTLGSGTVVELPELPERFSVYTKWYYERYQMVME